MSRRTCNAGVPTPPVLACTPAPAPVLYNGGLGFLGFDPYDLGGFNASSIFVQIFRDGVLFTTLEMDPSDVEGGGNFFLYTDAHTWFINFLLPDGTPYCSGVTPNSNNIDT